MSIDLIFVPLMGAVIVWGIIVLFVNPIKKNKRLKLYTENLELTGFNISKRIVTTDFTKASSFDTFVGIWVDYKSKQLAVRTSHKEVIPNVYEFKNIRSYKSTDGARGTISSGNTSGIGVGVGIIGVGRGKVNMRSDEMSRDISVRIVLGGDSIGIKAIHIPLWKNTSHTNFLSGGKTIMANSKIFQSFLECRRSICDELDYIIEIQ
jgi:hypothetical protein